MTTPPDHLLKHHGKSVSRGSQRSRILTAPLLVSEREPAVETRACSADAARPPREIVSTSRHRWADFAPSPARSYSGSQLPAPAGHLLDDTQRRQRWGERRLPVRDRGFLPACGLEGLQTRHDQPPFRSSRIDQLLGREARPGAQVSEVAFRGARPDADGRRRVSNRPSGCHEGGEDVDLAGGRRPGEGAAQVAVSHWEWLTPGSPCWRPPGRLDTTPQTVQSFMPCPCPRGSPPGSRRTTQPHMPSRQKPHTRTTASAQAQAQAQVDAGAGRRPGASRAGAASPRACALAFARRRASRSR